MLKLYHTPISPNSRRVWITLLEKEIPVELVSIQLNGDQLQPEFLELNPFHHIPVLVDDGFSIIESLAILDYLEAKYPTPAMLPSDAKALATVRMVEMVTINELLPALNPLLFHIMGIRIAEPQKLEETKQKVLTVLNFFESKLGGYPFFGNSNNLTRGDIVAGTVVPWLPSLNMPLDNYPLLSAWCDRLMVRESWQKTQTTLEEVQGFMKSRFQ